MSVSVIKYPSASGGNSFLTTLPVLIINKYGSGLTVTDVNLSNTIDSVNFQFVPGTGFEFPIPGVSGGENAHYAKGTFDVSIPPTVLNVAFSAGIPTDFNVVVTVYATSITTAANLYSGSGSYSIDVPIDVVPGDLIVIVITHE
jgi:hypothetical protein